MPSGLAGRGSACHGWRADERIIAHLADGFQRHVSSALDCPFVILFEQDRADESDDSVVVGKDADDIGAALDLAVETFDGICNRYKSFGADALLQFIELRRMLRASGTEAPGARRCGQADTLDELRARVSSWPPLRLARLRRERESVVVASPAAPVV